MSDHTAVALEIAGGLALTYAVAFAFAYLCCSRFVSDTTP